MSQLIGDILEDTAEDLKEEEERLARVEKETKRRAEVAAKIKKEQEETKRRAEAANPRTANLMGNNDSPILLLNKPLNSFPSANNWESAVDMAAANNPITAKAPNKGVWSFIKACPIKSDAVASG